MTNLESNIASGDPDPCQRIDLTVLAKKVFFELLKNRDYEQYLINIVMDKILLDNILKSDQLHTLSVPVKATFNGRSELISHNIAMLTRSLESVTETFLRSVDLCVCDCGSDVNRDAASLFSARIQIDRFLLSVKFDVARFEQTVRRITSLIRNFARRISTPFQVANCAFFASSLCDIFYRFEEYCSVHEKNSSRHLDKLRKAIEDFYSNVVIRLNQMLIARHAAEMKKRNLNQIQKQKPLRRSKSVHSFNREMFTRSSGYLLPSDLQKKRSAVRKISSGTPDKLKCLSFTTRRPSQFNGFISSCDQNRSLSMPKKVTRTVHLPENKTRGQAIRLAQEITNEVVNGLACMVDQIIMANDKRL